MTETTFPYLSLITFVPLIGAAMVLLLPKTSEIPIKLVALITSLVSLLFTLHVWSRFDPLSGLMFEERFAWIPAIHVDYRLAVDGLSIAMVLLTAIITPLALLAHWKLDRDVKLFFFLFLLLQTGMFGVFTALNFFHWFIFWELGLIPMYFLIKIWGAEDRTYASFKFFIYTLAGSVAMLLAFAFIYLATGSFDFLTLREQASSGELMRAYRSTHQPGVVHFSAVLGRVPRVRYQSANLAVPHVVTGCAHAGTDRRFDGAGGDLVENGRVRILAGGAAHFPRAGCGAFERAVVSSAGERHLRRVRGDGPDGFQAACRVLVHQSHGLRDAGHLRRCGFGCERAGRDE
jgi:NADH-quinone oxidoreductase subunit M